MKNSKIVTLMALMIFVLVMLIGTGLIFPLRTQAHPAFGFTPTPVPTRDHGGGGGGGETKPPDTIPPDFVLVRLDRCDLTCLEQYGQLGNPANLLAAGPSLDPDFNPLAMAASAVAAPEVQVPVQLVHQGSGFRVEQILSDAGATRIPVPYPGQWQVFITGNPQLVTATAFDISRTNLADFSASLAAGPIPVGLVEANTSEPQLVKCPVACVIEPTPTPQPEDPPFLPETGQAQGEIPPVIGLFLMGVGLLTIWLLAGVILWLKMTGQTNTGQDHSTLEQ